MSINHAYMVTCIHHSTDERKQAGKCPVCAYREGVESERAKFAALVGDLKEVFADGGIYWPCTQSRIHNAAVTALRHLASRPKP